MNYLLLKAKTLYNKFIYWMELYSIYFNPIFVTD